MEGSLTIRPQTARMRSAFEPRGVTPGPLDGPAGNLQSSLFFSAKIGFHRALELDDHRIPAAILRGGHLDSNPALGHVVFVHIRFLDAVEANAHIAEQDLFLWILNTC